MQWRDKRSKDAIGLNFSSEADASKACPSHVSHTADGMYSS